MRRQFALIWCDTCGRVTRGARPAPTVWRHLLLCLATMGLGLVLRPLVGRGRKTAYRCRYCGAPGQAVQRPVSELLLAGVGLAGFAGGIALLAILYRLL